MFRKLIILSASLLLSIPASAGVVTFSLAHSTMSSLPGGNYDPSNCVDTLSCVIFSGSLEFTTDQDYFLTDIATVMSVTNPDGGALVVGDDDYFQNNSVGVLGADNAAPPFQCGSDSCFAGGLFQIDVPSNAPYGSYNGTAALTGYTEDDPSTAVTFGTVDFTVDVVPEPSMGMLVFLGLCAIGLLAGRRRVLAVAHASRH